MLDASIDIAEANRNLQNEELHPFGHQVGKYVTVHRYPAGVEIFIDGRYETWAEPDPDAVEREKAKRGEGDRERSIDRSARRAKTKVRRLSKAMQADCLLTLTYREDMQDKKRLMADFKAFRARLQTLGAFSYIATVEKQQRGAYHLHIACHQFPAWLKDENGVRVKSYNLIRSMWRRVVGANNGNVDLTRPRGRNSAHRIASYISKYVMKNVADADLNAKAYWSSRDIVVPVPKHMWFPGTMPTWDIVSMLAREFVGAGFTDIAQYADRLNGFHWFSMSLP